MLVSLNILSDFLIPDLYIFYIFYFKEWMEKEKKKKKKNNYIYIAREELKGQKLKKKIFVQYLCID